MKEDRCGMGGEKRRAKTGQETKHLPWLCAFEGKWDTRTSNTSGANKHHLYFPMENILTTSSLDLHKEKEYDVDKMQSREKNQERKSLRERKKEKGNFSDFMNAIQLQSCKSKSHLAHATPKRWSGVS